MSCLTLRVQIRLYNAECDCTHALHETGLVNGVFSCLYMNYKSLHMKLSLLCPAGVCVLVAPAGGNVKCWPVHSWGQVGHGSHHCLIVCPPHCPSESSPQVHTPSSYILDQCRQLITQSPLRRLCWPCKLRTGCRRC